MPGNLEHTEMQQQATCQVRSCSDVSLALTELDLLVCPGICGIDLFCMLKNAF